MGLSGFSAQSHKTKIKVSASYTFIRRLWEEFTTERIPTVSKTPFLSAVGLRSPFPCWLSAEGHLQLEAPLWSLHVDPPSQNQQWCTEFSCLESLNFPFSRISLASSWRLYSAFKGSCDLDWALPQTICVPQKSC